MGNDLRWEDVPCPLCGARREQVLIIAHAFADHEGPLHRVVRCLGCGLGYLNPRPTEATIASLYRADYAPYQPRPPKRRPAWRDRAERAVLSQRWGHPPVAASWCERALARLLPGWFGPAEGSQTVIPYLGDGRLLDFGCGAGWYARRMIRRGWHVTGLEISAELARRVSAEAGVPVLAGSLPHPALPPGSFDVVNMGAVLEHVHDPHRVLAAAAALLVPGGLLVVSVPNLASAAFRWFGEDWFSLDLPYHLLHFNAQTLERAVKEHGLEVERLRQLGRSSWMRRSLAAAGRSSWLARLARRGPVPGWLTRYTVWRGQGENLLLWARKPRRAALVRAA